MGGKLPEYECGIVVDILFDNHWGELPPRCYALAHFLVDLLNWDTRYAGQKPVNARLATFRKVAGHDCGRGSSGVFDKRLSVAVGNQPAISGYRPLAHSIEWGPLCKL